MEKYIKEINYWLLARLPRWLVIVLYTIIIPVTIVIFVVGFLWVLYNLIQWAIVTREGSITVSAIIIFTILGVVAGLVNDSLPKREKKKTNDEEEELNINPVVAQRIADNLNSIFTDTELEQIDQERKKNKHYNDWIDQTFNEIRKEE